MLGNVYINKINARQCLQISLNIVGKVFPVLSISLMYPKESFTSNFKTAGHKRLFNGATSRVAWFSSICFGSDFSHKNGRVGNIGGVVFFFPKGGGGGYHLISY